MLIESVNGFDWNDGNLEKCQKHGVSIQALESAFQREISIFPDIIHSQDEERFISIGKTYEGRSIFIVFTLRIIEKQKFIRPISARYMHKKEIEHYEKTIARTS